LAGNTNSLIYTDDEKLNRKSFESALDYLLEFYLTIKPVVLVPYENSSSQSNESCWDSEVDSTTETPAREFFKEKIWNNECIIQIQSYDGADIDGNVSEISATSSLPLSDITDLDEFPTFETDNCA